MTRVAIVLAVALGAASQPRGQESGLERLISAPLPIAVTPDAPTVKDALRSRLAIISRLAGVSTGFEEALDDPRPSLLRGTVDLRGMSVGQALDSLVAADPRYEWREIAGVATVRSRAAWTDCTHFLHRQVSLERRDLKVSSASRALLHLIDPAVREFPSPDPPGRASGAFSVDVPEGTMLEVFNRTAIAGGLSWSLAYGPGESGSPWIEFSLESLNGSRVGWSGRLRPLPGNCRR